MKTKSVKFIPNTLYILGATLNAFKVAPITSIINNESWLSAVHGPSRKFDVALGRGWWLRDLAPRRPVERAPRRSPAGHPEHMAAGRDSDPARGRQDERSAHTTSTGVGC